MNQAEQMREAAANWCVEEATRYDDAVKRGGHQTYLSHCMAAAYALRNASKVIRALPLPPADPLADPRVKALADIAQDILSDLDMGAHPHLYINELRAALRGLPGEGGK